MRCMNNSTHRGHVVGPSRQVVGLVAVEPGPGHAEVADLFNATKEMAQPCLLYLRVIS